MIPSGGHERRSEKLTKATAFLVAVMPSYTFPLPGWNGPIELHHGSDKGAADLMANRGWPVVSITSGVVESAGNSPIGGNNVTIRGDDNLEYYYAHFDSTPMVQSGNRVNSGQRIGAVGNTGNAESTPPHLHIGIGPNIASGVGPHGGAGDNFNAVLFLQKLYAGDLPSGGFDGEFGEGIDGGIIGGIGGGITDAFTAGLAKILTELFKAFSGILRG